jgi:hypothetical protein
MLSSERNPKPLQRVWFVLSSCRRRAHELASAPKHIQTTIQMVGPHANLPGRDRFGDVGEACGSWFKVVTKNHLAIRMQRLTLVSLLSW